MRSHNRFRSLAPEGYHYSLEWPVRGKSEGLLFTLERDDPHTCRVPSWWARLRNGINFGDIWVCGHEECGQAWRWTDKGWYDPEGSWERIEIPKEKG